MDVDNSAQGPLLKNASSQTSPLIYVSGSKVRKLTTLTPEAFLDFCILLGTDASPRIPKIGPVTARKLIEKYRSIDEILVNEPKIAQRVADMTEFRGMVDAARKVFSELPPVPEGVMLEQGVWDEAEVDRLMEEKHGVKFVEPDGEDYGDDGR